MKKLITAIKNLLKQFLPPPVRAFNREVERILVAIGQGNKEITALRAKVAAQERMLAALVGELEAERRLAARQEEHLQALRQAAKAWAGEQEAALRQMEGRLSTAQDAHRVELLAQFTALGEGQAAAMATVNSGFTALSQTMEAHQKQGLVAAETMKQCYEGLEAFSSEHKAQQEQLTSQGQETRRTLSEGVERVRRQAVEASRHASEAVWAQIFNNTIHESTWLLSKTFAPGRWAVGYPYLYVMYRILNEARPKHILELGLGQSTRMIGQYAAAFEDVEHIVVEHDQEWIDFFCHDFKLSPRSRIVRLEREMVPYKDAEAVRVFKGFKEAFQGQRFDCISIDAPLGGDMKQYARIDVLGLMPDCLAKDFVIMVDDTERRGETHTLEEMERRLTEGQIPYKRGRYSGKKDCTVLCAEARGFLSSM